MFKKIKDIYVDSYTLNTDYDLNGLREFNGIKLKPKKPLLNEHGFWIHTKPMISTYEQYKADLKAHNRNVEKKVAALKFKIFYWLTIIAFVATYAVGYYFLIDKFRISSSLMLLVGVILAFLIIEKIIVNLGYILEAIFLMAWFGGIGWVLHSTVWVWLVKYW